MQTVNLSTLTLAQAANLIRKRHVSPIEVTRAYLQRIEQLKPRISA